MALLPRHRLTAQHAFLSAAPVMKAVLVAFAKVDTLLSIIPLGAMQRMFTAKASQTSTVSME